jgi:hypothetical protein
MLAVFLASAGTEFGTARGSRQPFAGWVAVDAQPRSAHAFTADQPSRNSWALALWVREKPEEAGTLAAPPAMLEWTDAERWKVRVPLRRAEMVVERTGRELVIQTGAGNPEAVRVALAAPPDVSATRAAVTAAYDADKARSVRSKELLGYRVRITYILLALLAVQEAVLLLLRYVVPRYATVMRTAAGLAWLAGGAWIALVYLS